MNMKNISLLRVMVAMIVTLAFSSCLNNEYHVEKKLTEKQKEDFGNTIKGEYKGKYIIYYTDAECGFTTDENGKVTKAGKDVKIENAMMSVGDYDLKSIAMHKFPVSILSNIVDADADISKALATLPDMDLSAKYHIAYDTNYTDILFYIQPNVLYLTLNYRGADHHIRIELNNSNRVYCFSPKDLEKQYAFKSANDIVMNVVAIYDGAKLVQKFDLWEGNGMYVTFDIEK